MTRTDMFSLTLSSLAAAALLTACADDLAPAPEAPAPMGADLEHFVTTEEGGVFATRVDAESDSAWRFFDFETHGEVTESSPAWDVAFQRFRIKSNGGISGTGGVEVATLVGQDFATLAAPPSDGYSVDAADSEDMDSEPDYAFNAPNGASETGWYIYNMLDHTLGATKVVYVLRTVEGAAVKIELLGYYADNGTGGHPRFRWATLAAPRP